MEPTLYVYQIRRKSTNRYSGMIVCAPNSDEAILYHPNNYHRANIEENYWFFISAAGIQLQSNQEDRLFELWAAGTITNMEYQIHDRIDEMWVPISELKSLDVLCLGTAAPYLQPGVIAIIESTADPI